MSAVVSAHRVRVRGVVQGVGFRPHVYRLARLHGLTGWVANGGDGVEIHAEGDPRAVREFLHDLEADAPPAARIAGIETADAVPEAHSGFQIRESRSGGPPTTRISPDLPVCDACLRELFDPADRRAFYPYINCTDCGPRFSIVRALPYDRPRTTMAAWPMCPACAREYGDPADRRFHAQPAACPACGPRYTLSTATGAAGHGPAGTPADGSAIAEAARLLRDGAIVGIKGIGGYHLACNAAHPAAVAALRDRKYRKEQAFAVMVRDVSVAHATCVLSADAEALLRAPARPIVLAPRRLDLPGVAPDNPDLGVILPYAPVHHLLFAHGAPDRLVMTSGNRSSEPIAFEDEDARGRLDGIADAILAGERPIARRLDDSVARAGTLGPMILRRSRGMAPGAVAVLPASRPILALGGDLKNTIALVVDGQAYVSQHLGDLAHYGALVAFRETIADLTAMYAVSSDDLLVVHDAHPQYASTSEAGSLRAAGIRRVQHHRAHVASVLAERGALDRRVVGLALDGTGYGDDGGIWGGEIFAGSVEAGFERAAHLRPALLPGGDAAARHPVQAAAGYVDELDALPDLTAAPFGFPERYRRARELTRGRVRTFTTTSTGRLFDTAAAIAGFTRPITFEGQAAMWLEHLARRAGTQHSYPARFDGREIDWRPLLASAIAARAAGTDPAVIARAFHRGLARVLAEAASALLDRFGLDTVVLSGGVVQNQLLLADFLQALGSRHVQVWMNNTVPPNDGGLSLGQAALACLENTEEAEGTA